jgi:hypothetical protein
MADPPVPATGHGMPTMQSEGRAVALFINSIIKCKRGISGPKNRWACDASGREAFAGVQRSPRLLPAEALLDEALSALYSMKYNEMPFPRGLGTRRKRPIRANDFCQWSDV